MVGCLPQISLVGKQFSWQFLNLFEASKQFGTLSGATPLRKRAAEFAGGKRGFTATEVNTLATRFNLYFVPVILATVAIPFSLRPA